MSTHRLLRRRRLIRLALPRRRSAAAAACVPGDRGRSADIRLDAADVVPAEQALDHVHVGQWTASAGDPLRGRFPDRTAVGPPGTVRGTLHRQLLGERPLAGVEAGRTRATRTPLSARALSLI